MAATVTAPSRIKISSVGNRTVVDRILVGDASPGYPTGGWVVTAAQCGLSQILKGGLCRISAGFSAAFAHADALAQTDGSVKIRLRAAAGTEVPNGTDASTVTILFDCQGY